MTISRRPPSDGAPRRQFGCATLSYPFILTQDHLDYRGDPYIRTGQNADMIRIASQFAGPQILLGDLNARPEQPEMQPVGEHCNRKDRPIP